MEASPLVLKALLSPEAAFHPHLTQCNEPYHSNEIENRRRGNEAIPWRCDGVDVDNARFYAYPAFAEGSPPLRTDVYISEPTYCRTCRQHDAESMNTRTFSIQRLEHHLVQTLQTWSSELSGFKEQYNHLPFGSRIVVDLLTPTNAFIIPDYTIEERTWTFQDLQTEWKLNRTQWPTVIDLTELQLMRQPHDAISAVTIDSRHGKDLFVFKSASGNIQFLYHELKMLLSLDPSPYVQEPPLYIVSKASRFGNKPGIVGFVHRYEPIGSLHDVLNTSYPNPTLRNLQNRYEIALHVVLGLLHIVESTMGYYPDLKPANILLRSRKDSSFQAFIIDLEQRGGLQSLAPPEIFHIDHIEALTLSNTLPLDIKERYKQLIAALGRKYPYRDPRLPYSSDIQGFSYSWLLLTNRLRERAMVFSLGKLLWCIFENQASTNSTIGLDVFQHVQSGLTFPNFAESPRRIRKLIERCTSGAPERDGNRSMLTVQDRRLILRNNGERSSITTMQEAVRKWWIANLAEAEKYADLVTSGVGAEEMVSAKHRPTLREVLYTLEIERSYLSGFDSIAGQATNTIKFRRAKWTDVEAMADIALIVSEDNPVDQWRYPYAVEHPQDFRMQVEARFKRYIWDAEKSATYVVLIADIEEKAVGYRIWQVPGGQIGQSALESRSNAIGRPSVAYDELQHAHVERRNAYKRDIIAAKKRLFDNKFGEQQLAMTHLARHPAHSGHGIGRLLMEYALQEADFHGVPATLFCTNAKLLPFYMQFGFKVIEILSTKGPGEDEGVATWCMVRDSVMQ